VADALDLKVEGLKELADKLRGMGPDLSRNVLRAAVRAGAQMQMLPYSDGLLDTYRLWNV